jgi:radical SAM superfamily enzyme YgiQ (UPF0313 family)
MGLKVVLINPSTNTEYPQPPLGLLSIGTVCLEAGHKVRIIDANANRLTHGDIVKQVRTADVVGITATSLAYSEAKILAGAIKLVYPGVHIIIGGVHATVATSEVIDSGLFDSVVVGEGENVIAEALADRNDRTVWKAKDAVELDDMLPLNYELLEGFVPKMSYGRHQPFMPMFTSRGCPFSCSFCSKAVFGKNYRVKKLNLVMADIKRLNAGYGIREIKFYDDVFTLDKLRTQDLALMIGGHIDWSCMTRVNLVDKPTLKIMAQNGCHHIAYGIESGDPEILKGISKNITIEQIEQAVRYSKEAGLKVIGYFMLGAPGETAETIQKTVDFAIDLGVDHAQFSVATALPGSELYEQVAPELRANTYAMNGRDNPSLCCLSPAQLKTAQRYANIRFIRGE